MAITISGSGIVEANLADNAVTLAKMASGTDGEILTYDASGNPTAVSVGTDGQVLTSTGAGSPPAFETAAGGKVLQMQTFSTTSSTNTTSTSYVDTALSLSFTPTSSSSTLFITVDGTCRITKTGTEYNIYYRATVDGSEADGNYHYSDWQTTSANRQRATMVVGSFSYTNSNTTAKTIKIQMKVDGGETINFPHSSTGKAELTVWEIGA